MGLVPLDIKVGDQIVVVLGAAWLFLLRSTKGSEQGFRLVGYCYMHGLMAGDGLAPKCCEAFNHMLR